MTAIVESFPLGRVCSSTVHLVTTAAREINGRNRPLPSRTQRLSLQPGSLNAAKFSPIYLRCMQDISAFVCRQEGRIPQTPDDYRFLCMALIQCRTLEEAIDTVVTFSNAFFNGRGGTRSLALGPDCALFQFNKNYVRSTKYASICDFFSFLLYHNLFSWLIAEPLSNVKISTSHKKWIDDATLIETLGFPIRFEEPVNTLSFDRKDLSKPVVRAYHELSQVLAHTHFELMRTGITVNLSIRVENIVRKALLLGARVPSFTEVAEILCQGEPTLRRNLAGENTSYQKIIDQCRASIATDMLRSSRLSIDEISDSLGFGATSAFSRAFKSWLGCSPSAFRRGFIDSAAEPGPH